MHQIRFSFDRPQGVEHAVLEVGPSKCRWYLHRDATVSTPLGEARTDLAKVIVGLGSASGPRRQWPLKDYATRWPVYQRRRRLRRWRVELEEAIDLMRCDLQERFQRLRQRLVDAHPVLSPQALISSPGENT